MKETRGDGVVGEQPYLKPGQGFRYFSGAVIESPVGTMQGSYQMMADNGQQFDAPIAPFRLAIPECCTRKMSLYAIGDVQGCAAELDALLEGIRFSPDRDRLWFVGGSGQSRTRIAAGFAARPSLGSGRNDHAGQPRSAPIGRGARVRAPAPRRHADGDIGRTRPRRVAQWLMHRPLLHEDRTLNLCLLHAGLPPQWDMPAARGCAREFERALQLDPKKLLRQMYGDKPDRWADGLSGAERLRFTVNCFTRLRYVDAGGRLALRVKGAPKAAQRDSLIPWFQAPQARWRGPRIVLAIGRRWDFSATRTSSDSTRDASGGSLTAIELDAPDAEPVCIECKAARSPSSNPRKPFGTGCDFRFDRADEGEVSRPRYNAAMQMSAPFNLRVWIDQNRGRVKPPVGNKLLFEDSEFIIMAVGGPD